MMEKMQRIAEDGDSLRFQERACPCLPGIDSRVITNLQLLLLMVYEYSDIILSFIYGVRSTYNSKDKPCPTKRSLIPLGNVHLQLSNRPFWSAGSQSARGMKTGMDSWIHGFMDSTCSKQQAPRTATSKHPCSRSSEFLPCRPACLPASTVQGSCLGPLSLTRSTDDRLQLQHPPTSRTLKPRAEATAGPQNTTGPHRSSPRTLTLSQSASSGHTLRIRVVVPYSKLRVPFLADVQCGHDIRSPMRHPLCPYNFCFSCCLSLL